MAAKAHGVRTGRRPGTRLLPGQAAKFPHDPFRRKWCSTQDAVSQRRVLRFEVLEFGQKNVHSLEQRQNQCVFGSGIERTEIGWRNHPYRESDSSLRRNPLHQPRVNSPQLSRDVSNYHPSQPKALDHNQQKRTRYKN